MRYKRILSLIMVLIILFGTFTQNLYAVEDGVDGPVDTEESGDELDSGVDKNSLAHIYGDLSRFQYDDSIFDTLLEYFYNDSLFTGYYEDGDLELKIPHVVTFFGGSEYDKDIMIKIDKDFYRLKNHSVGEPYPTALTSNFIKVGPVDGVMSWAGSPSDYKSAQHRYYKNLYVATLVKVGPDYKDKVVHYDSYGNLITNQRKVIVPFFMNDNITRRVIKDNEDLFEGDILKNVDSVSFVPYVPSDDVYAKMLEVAGDLDEDFKIFYIDSSGNPVYKSGKMSEIVKWLGSNDVGGGRNSIDPIKSKEFVSTYYRNYVKEANEFFMGRVEEYYEKNMDVEDKDIPPREQVGIGRKDHGDSTLGMDDIKEKRDEMLENLLVTILTGGFGELLRLTLAYGVAEVYSEIFIEFSAKYIFHTEDYTESNLFINVMGAYIVFIIVMILLNLLLSIVSLLRGRITIGKVLTRVLIVVIVMTVPIVVYNKTVQVVFNQLPSKLVKEEVRQTMILDRWALIEEEAVEALKDVKLPFVLNREFRGTQYNYLIKFYTDQFVRSSTKEEYDMFYSGRSDDDLASEKELSKSNEKRVVLYVDANHLMDFFASGEDNLFNYLIDNEPGNYLGLTGNKVYLEYARYLEDDDILDKDVFTEGKVTASELGAKMYEYYERADFSLYERLSAISTYLLSSEIDNEKREEVLNKLSKIPSIDEKAVYDNLTRSDFNSDAEYQKFLAEKALMEMSNYGDITGIYEFLKEITVIEDGVVTFADSVAEAKYLEKEKKLKEIAFEINRAIVNEYMDTILNLRGNFRGGQTAGLEKAIEDVTIMNMFFILNDKLGMKFFPTDIETSRVESDAFIRSLVIPFRDMTPTNKSIENASLYVGTNKSIFTLLFFVIMVIVLSIYGLIKMIVISKLLLPVVMILMIWNYIIQEKYENKLLIGAGYILAIFTIVHWGFIGLWKYSVYQMNLGLIGDSVGGRSSFFNTFTNSALVIVYFFIAIKFLIVPTLKTAVKNYNDLGGEVVSSKIKEKVGAVKSALSKSKLGQELGKNIPEGMTPKGATDAEKAKIEKLKQDKNMADANKEGLGGETVYDIDKELNIRKNRMIEAGAVVSSKVNDMKSKVRDTALKFIPSRVKDGLDIVDEEKEKEIKAKIDALKNKGIFIATADTIDVDGEASSEIKLKNTAMSYSVDKFMKEKGFKTELKKNSVHVEGTDEDIMYYTKDLEKHLEESKKELETVITFEGDSVAKVYEKGKTMTLDYDLGTENRLAEMKEAGIINNYKVRTENGEKKLIVHAYEPGYRAVIEMLDTYERVGFQDSIKKVSLDLPENDITMDMVKELKGEGKIKDYEIVKDSSGQKRIQIIAKSSEVGEINNRLDIIDGYSKGEVKLVSFDYDEEALAKLQGIENNELIKNIKIHQDGEGNKKIGIYIDNISDKNSFDAMDLVESILDVDSLSGYNPENSIVLGYDEKIIKDLDKRNLAYTVYMDETGNKTSIEISPEGQNIDSYEQFLEDTREYAQFGKDIKSKTKQAHIRMNYDRDVEKELQSLQEIGLVESFEIEQDITGGNVLVVNAPINKLGEIERHIKVSFKDELTKSVQTKSIVEVNSNIATDEVLRSLVENKVIESYSLSPNGKRFEIDTNKLASIISEIETTANSINEIKGLGLGEKTIKLNANNDIVASIMQNYEELVGKDFVITAGEYVPITDNGYKILSKVAQSANKIKDEVIKDYENTKEIEIKASNAFIDSNKNKGRRHIIDNLAYTPENIAKVLEELRYETMNYKGDDEEKLEIKRILNSIHDIRNSADGFVIYSESDLTNKDVEKLVNHAQDVIKKSTPPKRGKPKKKEPTVEEKLAEILDLLSKGKKESE